MATNFEFYKDYLSNVIAQREGRCIVMEADDIMKRGFHRFCKGPDCGECWRKLFKYLAEEHIEQPKLTKRERAFCEAVQTGWIARDKNGSLFWYGAMPGPKGNAIWVCCDPRSYQMFNMGSLFKFIAWSDEKPWSIEDLLKLEVE